MLPAPAGVVLGCVESTAYASVEALFKENNTNTSIKDTKVNISLDLEIKS